MSSYANRLSPNIPPVHSFVSSPNLDKQEPVTEILPCRSVTDDHLTFQRSFSIPLSNSTEDVNSMFEYMETSPIFHSSKGIRGGIRLNGGSAQDIASLLKTNSLPRTSFHPQAFRSDDDELHHRSPDHFVYLNRPLEGSDEKQEVDSCLQTCEVLLRLLLRLSKQFDVHKLRFVMMCSRRELNTHAPPNARLCYDFFNFGYCKREKMTGTCKYRHLASDHIITIMDKIFSGKVALHRQN